MSRISASGKVGKGNSKMEKWVYCPRCGPGLKLFKLNKDSYIQGDGIEQKCRGCKRIIQISEDGKTRVLSE